MKAKVTDKAVYGGMHVDKFFLILDNGEDVQVPEKEWDDYQIGDSYEYPVNPDTENKQT